MSAPCGICGSMEGATWLDQGQWRYRRCAECAAVWLDPLPADDWAESFYDLGYFAGGGRGGYRDYLADEAQHRINARARVALARDFGATPPAAWLDVGCAAGFTLDEARKAGFIVLGVELSAWARGVARERLGLKVVPTLGEARRELPQQADVVSFFQVLEHLHDPLAALREAHACLRPGGLLIVETWDRGSLVARLLGRYWHQITPPSVLWLLNCRNLEHVLERAGFRPQRIVRGRKRVSVGWVIGILADKAPGILGPALKALGRSGLRRLGFSYGLGDLVFVLASAAGGERAAHDSPNPLKRLRAAGDTDCSN